VLFAGEHVKDGLGRCHTTEIHQREGGREETVDQRAVDDDVPQSIVYHRQADRQRDQEQSAEYVECHRADERQQMNQQPHGGGPVR
jgi:hypothetical protein